MQNNAITREEELELLSGLLADNQAAWRRFHRQYHRLIYRCIRKVTGRFSSVLREEDQQEIFANLVVQLLNRDKHRLRSFDPDRGCRLGTWVGMLATPPSRSHHGRCQPPTLPRRAYLRRPASREERGLTRAA